ncbi:PEP-CTERM sorting domain-containing protein [Chamaesiphon minutus]|uniref:Phospholipase/lecithinase/hemolysin n=1 Tax=Chamaesiphon minutus (strain ATCC 27169 / PCC 6605) TaxID=1173020 RepID=K9UCH9_CHAP6|nr:PEP-CTERM sorting domain-containing protein [Chamaesiphon minutus]AFY91919.1 phospholipase/lecithinase/hemolysin [Chamaesiphon minutus PCC 6605]
MKRFLIVGGLIIASTLAPVKAIAATFSQLVVYGDSLSDLGRAAAATSAFPPGSQFPAYTNGGGRFSNGPIWVEYLAARLGIPSTPSTNFAIGGAKTSTINIGQPAPGFIGIQTQVTDNAINDPAALYVIWGGANDYLSSTPADPANPIQTIANLTGEINTLIGRGATNILIPNLPNLGALPSTRNLGAVAVGLNNLTAAHNAGLATAISNLSLANPTVTLNLLNVNSLFDDVVASPSSFGFTDVTTQCITISSLCTNPNTNLFWDDIHPTTATHKLIGDLAFNTVSPTAVPEPMTVVGSLMAFGSAIAFKRKLKPADVTAKELVESN